ncbi:MAG: DUF4149 domain-containing protein [Desulfobulbus sp.]|jgi:hypothetical protein|nr:DUF4149 domain-containing protein [Desulfobulbus sp.]
MKIVTFCYQLAISCWLGGSALFTFLLTPILFRAYSRDMAGGIVGVLLPGYFRWALVCGGVALLCRLLLRGRFTVTAALILTAMLALTTVQATVIEPRAAALKVEIPSFDTTPADHPLRVQFRRLHSFSMAANLAVIGGGVVLILLAVLTPPGVEGHDRVLARPRRRTTSLR